MPEAAADADLGQKSRPAWPRKGQQGDKPTAEPKDGQGHTSCQPQERHARLGEIAPGRGIAGQGLAE